MSIRRQVSYQWRLREVMAQRGLFATTELVPLLAERGISLSASQVHRLVTGIPERLSLPVLAALAAMDKPSAGLIWLHNPKVPQLLGELASGRIPLTRQGLHAAPSWRTAAYLRDLLMTCGVLPTIDKQLIGYEALLRRRLVELADSPHLRLLRQFADWQQLPRPRAKAERRPLTPDHRQYASDQLTQATAFLGWLAQRGHTLAEATQADLDAWPASHNDRQRRTLRAFLRWAMATGHLPRLQLPRLAITGPRRSPSTAGWSCSAASSPAATTPCAPAWPPA